MFAVRHPAVRNLWFDFDRCTWTFYVSYCTKFASKSEAAEYATLPSDGGVAAAV